MTPILFTTALFSLLLALLFWGAVRLLGARPYAQSALLITAAFTLIGLPVVVFVSDKGPVAVVEGVDSFSQPTSVQTSLVTTDLNLFDGSNTQVLNSSGAKVVNGQEAGTPGQVSSASPTGGKVPLLGSGYPKNVEAGNLVAGAASMAAQPVRSTAASLESVSTASLVEISIPASVNKVLPYLALLWIVGAVVCGLRFLVHWVRFYRSARYHQPVADADLENHIRRMVGDMGMRRLPVLVCSDEPGPYCYGMIRRRLHLPVALLKNSSREEISMILHHELQHIRQHDLVLLMLQLPVRIFYWWNPLVTRLMKQLDYVRETLCDRAASEGSPEEYAHLLLQFAAAPSPSCQTAVAMASSAKVMKARIKNLYSPSKKDLKVTGLACAVVATGITALLLTNVRVEAVGPLPGESSPQAEDQLAGQLGGQLDLTAKAPAAGEVIHRILHAAAGERTRIASGQKLPNNPVTVHYEKYQQAKEVLDVLLSRVGERHPSVIAQKKIMHGHLQLADQSVFELLLMLQKNLDVAVLDHSKKLSESEQQIAIEDPKTFYPVYLKKLTSLPTNKQLDYAAALPVSNNPALIHRIEKQLLESSLHDALADGLGSKHPHVVGLQRRLEIYGDQYAEAALKITIGLLKNKDRKPPGRMIFQLFAQRREVSRLRAEGLGFKHPDVVKGEQHIRSLEKKIHEWNQKEQRSE